MRLVFSSSTHIKTKRGWKRLNKIYCQGKIYIKLFFLSVKTVTELSQSPLKLELEANEGPCKRVNKRWSISPPFLSWLTGQPPLIKRTLALINQSMPWRPAPSCQWLGPPAAHRMEVSVWSRPLLTARQTSCCRSHAVMPAEFPHNRSLVPFTTLIRKVFPANDSVWGVFILPPQTSSYLRFLIWSHLKFYCSYRAE